jgi:hypothetical protein
VIQADLLPARVLRARTPDDRVLHLLRDLLVDVVAEVLDRALAAAQHDGRGVVRREPARLRVHAHEVERLPPVRASVRTEGPRARANRHGVDQLVDVPPVRGGDGHAHRDLVQQIELLDGDGVDLRAGRQRPS